MKIFPLLLILLSIPLLGEYGVKIGVSNSKIMYDSHGIEKGESTGLRGGIFYRFRIGKSRISIQPEIFYVEKGVNLSLDLVGQESARAEIMRKYIEIPLIVRFNLLKRKYLYFDVYLGAYGAYNLSAKQKLKYQDQVFVEDYSYFTKKYDFGYTAGGIVSFSIGKGKALFDFRFTTGLVDTRKNYYSGNTGSVKNSTFSLMAGYAF